MDLKPGDIIKFHSVQAGYPKYHLCVLEITDDKTATFLFMNSKSAYVSDFVLDNSDVPCLPPSKTKKTVISCSQLVRANEHQLKIYGAKKMGTLDKSIAKRLIPFVENTKALSKKDKDVVTNGLKRIIE
jgi:hypothetical protein